MKRQTATDRDRDMVRQTDSDRQRQRQTGIERHRQREKDSNDGQV